MPEVEKYGAQPPIELLRQFMDHEGWYDRTDMTWRTLEDLQFCAAMGPPGGGRSEISTRTQSRFNVLNFTFPSDAQVIRIYQTLLSNHILAL